MKILHYIPSIGKAGGGVSAYLQLLSHDLGKLVELHIVTHHSTEEMRMDNCTVHYIEGNIRHPMRMKRGFYSLLDTIKPDVVHVNGCWLLQCSWTIFWAKAKGYKVILSPHGMLEPWDIRKNYWTKKLPALLLYQRRSITVSDLLIATAETERQNLQKLGYNDRVEIVPNGIVVNGIDTKNDWQERKHILFLALYRKNKGIDLLMEAAAKLKDKLQGWKITIAGLESDYTVDNLKAMARQYGVEENVEVIGGLFGENKWNAYRSADVFVLPTLNENFGIVIAESYLCGTPVITTKGAPWALIAEHNCGWWVDRTVNCIVNAMEEFLKTSVDERKRMGLTGRNVVIERFASNKVAENMMEKYKQLALSSPHYICH